MPDPLKSDEHGSLIQQGFDGLRDATNRLQQLLDKIDDVEAVDAAAFSISWRQPASYSMTSTKPASSSAVLCK